MKFTTTITKCRFITSGIVSAWRKWQVYIFIYMYIFLSTLKRDAYESFTHLMGIKTLI